MSKEQSHMEFLDLAKLGTALHALCPRSTRIGDACEGVGSVTPEGLMHTCGVCDIKDKLLLPYQREEAHYS